MLLQCTVSRWQGWPNKEKECILNTRRMSMVEDISDPLLQESKSRLLYSYREGHRRGNLHSIDIDKSPTQINTASELVPYDDFVALPVYEDDDVNSTPVTKYFKVRDIARVIADPESNWRCYVWIHHNEVRLRRYLVKLNIEQLYERAMNGETATSTPEETTSEETTTTTRDT